MINFRIYDMNERKLIAYNLKKEQVPPIVEKNKNKRIMVVKHDKGDEIVDKYTLTSLKDMSCVDLKRDIVKRLEI